MQWTNDQQKIIDSRNCNLLVSAAAGSGKTAVLVERIIRMITDPNNSININELLVVTFTKAAASQMREKIRFAMENILEKNPENRHIRNQLHLLNQANILTIDSFCYKVVKEHFYALGIDPGVRIGEAGELALLKKEVMAAVIEKHYREDPDFVAFSEAFCADKTDDKLEEYIENVYEVSSSFPRPDIWIEQAKKELFIASEDMFMNLSYVQAYLHEIKDTAIQLKQQVIEVLELARGIDGPLYMEKALLSDVVFLDDIINAKNYTTYHELAKTKFANIGRGKDGTYDKDIAETIKSIRNRYKDDVRGLLKVFLLPFEQVLFQLNDQSKMLDSLLNVTKEFRDDFLTAKLEKNILEFSDVEHFALQILCDGYDEGNQPIPSEIGCEMADGFYEIMIDEYQDSNYLQEAILYCVSRMSSGHNNIFMVGDVKQSIYSFRMARPDLFMEKYHTYQEDMSSPKRKLLLKNNFRSRANVLQGINYIFYQIMGRDLGGIDYTREEALVPSREFPLYDNDNVELLIGEGKNFDFQATNFEAESEYGFQAQKEETLDENLEDIGKKELEATMIANKIDVLMGKKDGKKYQVTDTGTNCMRDITYKDIVILLRAPAGFSDIFYEILMGRGIPVRIQNETGYLDTVEIHQILSLLRTVDNPYNEVELVASLRGYFGGLTEEELAKIILGKKCVEQEIDKKMFLYDFLLAVTKRSTPTYDAWKKQMNGCDEALYEKCVSYVELIKELSDKIHYMSISQTVQWIYYQRDYYFYVQAMPQGKERSRNLTLLMDEILHFEQSSYHGLFEFLKYIDEIIENKISLGGDPSMDCDDNVVRIMSIHKSKGLEFPVVFVAGMGKQFNLTDTKENLIVHSDYYLGAKYINGKKRCGNDTFTRQVFAALMGTESIAEELRIFYVALTRAQEKLIMTGVVPDIPKLIHKYDSIAGLESPQIGFANIRNTNSYMDFVVISMIRNREFFSSMKQVRPRYDMKNEVMITADYDCSRFIEKPCFDLVVEISDYCKMAIEHVTGKQDKDVTRKNQIHIWKNGIGGLETEFEKHLDFLYQYMPMTKQKTKLSVTEIKRMYEIPEGNTDIGYQDKNWKHNLPVPEFVKENQIMSAAQKGTYVHKIMELFDFKNMNTEEDVSAFLNDVQNEKLSHIKICEILTVDKIIKLAQSDLGKRISHADQQGKLYKERKFVVGVPASKLYQKEDGETPDDYTIVVQGIIDLYFEEDDQLILVDYKTDSIKPGMEHQLIERYKTQLQYYKDTLEQLSGKKVRETYIYSFSLDKTIPIL